MSLESQLNKDSLHRAGKTTFTSPATRTLAATALRLNSRRATSSNDTRDSQIPEIPSPTLFNFTSRPRHGKSSAPNLPTVAQCAAHLELLEVFYVLRQRILASEDIDKAMGIEPDRVTKTGHNGDTKTLKDDTFWERRQVKWTKFVEFAAVRFLVWRQTLFDLTANSSSQDVRFNLGFLPPLDVLMIWHSFMLNPKMLATYCRDEPLMGLRMPWHMVHAAIDSREWEYTLSSAHQRHFEGTMGLPADLFEQFSTWLSGGDVCPEHPKLDTFILRELEDGTTKDMPKRISIKTWGKSLTDKYLDFFQSVDGDLAIQLRDAVIRQASFVDKMNAHIWIRSPAVEGTIRRGIDRYTKFLQLLKLYPSQTIVPTLDIDLVWHTHQCLAGDYGRAMKTIVGRFINHDDTIVKEKLGDGFAVSRKWFKMRFGKEYRVCGCWDCEALLSGLESAGEQDEVNMAAIAKQAMEHVSYYRAVELAIRHKERIPLPCEYR